jgi:hypothetical protein
MSVMSEFFSVCVIIAQYGDVLRNPHVIGVQKVIEFSKLERSLSDTEC